MTRQAQKQSYLRTREPKKYDNICNRDLGHRDEISININTQQIVIMKQHANHMEEAKPIANQNSMFNKVSTTKLDQTMKREVIFFEDEYGCIQKVQACYIPN